MVSAGDITVSWSSNWRAVFQCQLDRYRAKGLSNICLALSILSVYFVGMHTFLHFVWSTLLDCFSNRVLFVGLLMCANIVPLIVYNLGFMILYKFRPPFFQKDRVSQDSWPWNGNSSEWHEQLKKTVTRIAINVSIGQLLLLVVFSKINFYYKFSLQEFPNVWTHLWQALLFLVVEDAVFTFTHASLHRKQLYHLHKQHHQYNIAVSIGAQYASIYEFLYSNLIPAGAGFFLLNKIYPVHLSSIVIWIVLRIFETTNVHSGYDFSWSPFGLLPLSASAEYHGFHHSHNVGNFGSFFVFWDSVFGNNKEYYRFKSRHDNIKNRLQQNTNKND